MFELSELDKNALDEAQLNIEGLRVCRDEVKGSLWLTIQTSSRKINLSFNGSLEAVSRLYKDCCSHRKVILFGIN